MASSTRHIFLASLGNPSPYANTLHSAGHILLTALATHLSCSPFSSNPSIKPGVSTTSTTGTLTLWQSPVQMNISGPSLSRAWKSYLQQLSPGARLEAKLYIVHDELELPLGKVKVRHSGSHKGHNGLKSVFQAWGGKADGFSRVGIGIGRPESREPGDVSKFVLRRCTSREMEAIKGAAEEVARVLEIE